MTRPKEAGCTQKTLHAQIVDACSFRNDCQPGDGRTLRFSATNELFDLKQAAMSKLTDCNTGHPQPM
jgi:hypothetical protein